VSFFTVAWGVPANIGLLPQHPGDGEDPLFTVGWTVKRGATYYPFDATGLLVPPGGNDAPPSGGDDGGGGGGAPSGDGGGGTTTPAGGGAVTGAGGTVPSPQIRAHIAAANVAKRKDPGLFRRKGLTFALSLEAPATVTAVLVTSSGARKLTYSQTRKLTAGTDHITLRPSEYGKLTTRKSKRVQARLEITVKYADQSSGKVTRSVVLQAPPKR
jgi:hypothetical protein